MEVLTIFLTSSPTHWLMLYSYLYINDNMLFVSIFSCITCCTSTLCFFKVHVSVLCFVFGGLICLPLQCLRLFKPCVFGVHIVFFIGLELYALFLLML